MLPHDHRGLERMALDVADDEEDRRSDLEGVEEIASDLGLPLRRSVASGDGQPRLLWQHARQQAALQHHRGLVLLAEGTDVLQCDGSQLREPVHQRRVLVGPLVAAEAPR